MSSSSLDLSGIGLSRIGKIYHNYSRTQLYTHALREQEVVLSDAGALISHTAPYTGRCAEDKFIVCDQNTEQDVCWNNKNKPFTPQAFENLYRKICAFLQGREVFIQDLYVGAAQQGRYSFRVVTQKAWHSLFAYNMFLRPSVQERESFVPDFTLIHVPEFQADTSQDETRSAAFITISFMSRLILIGGTAYAGEIKKSVFSVMNYLLPKQGILPMHCSANQGKDGRVALFFGLSGTGKTTLSADKNRQLLGDDEHGWGEGMTFNFEGGCYAKTIGLKPETEPEIYTAVQKFGTILENVVYDRTHGKVDFDDDSITENTRACYPITHMENVVIPSVGLGADHVIFLTADAFGVFPPVVRLLGEQIRYYFLSGYTARLAGTELGITEPKATFSTCFGAPFMVCYPSVYADMLEEKIRKNDTKCWLVNTGWIGGGYGVGHRIRLEYTRAIIRALLKGELDKAPYMKDHYFGLHIPKECPGVRSDILNPQNMWENKTSYEQAVTLVRKKFEENFKQFEKR